MSTAVITTITADGLRAKLDAGDRFEFWNVLTDNYFGGEMIPGSRRVPLDLVGREVSGTNLDKHGEIVLYCNGGVCTQGGQAAEKLATFGFTNLTVFEAGLEAWKEAGFPVESV
jgi:rhodanese-related sulfurtransferase